MSLEETLRRAITREKKARQEAETLLEKKSLELWNKNQELEQANSSLERKVLDGRREMERLSRFPVENPQPVLRTDLNGGIEFSNAPFQILFEEYEDEIMKFVSSVSSDIENNETKNLNFSYPHRTFNVVVVQVETHRYINFYFTDITPLRKATDVIKFNEEKYRGVIESIELGLLELDHRLVVSKVYPKVLDITGFNESYVLGKKAAELLAKPEEFSLADFKSGVVETKVKSLSGDDLWVRISTAPLQNVGGEKIGYIAVIQDVTKSHLRFDQLQEAQRLAVESGKAKERFLANMSHELRTPMNAISGMAQLLHENVQGEKEQKYIQTIIKATNNLLVVLDDVLNLSKIEAGHLELEIRETSLFGILEHVKSTMSMKALEKGISFNVEVNDKNIHDIIKTDNVRLGQVLLNLVGNAIKFTQEGFVKIKVDLVGSFEDSQNLRFTVQDSGVGIKPENLERIFQAFSQADNSIERKFGGTGLGLAISKQIVASFGGELSVQSVPEVGSSFSFELNFSSGLAIQEEQESAVFDLSKLEGVDVILAEDNEFNGLLVEELLMPLKVKLRWAKNGLEVLAMVEESVPNLILMDIQMPAMGGEECSKILRQKYSKEELRIVALTANVFRKDIATYKEIGMNAYLSKPFKKNELYQSLLGDGLVSLPQKEGVDLNDDFSYSLEILAEMVGGIDSSAFKKMVDVFIEHTPNSLTELSLAGEQMSLEGVKSSAHKLKSSFRLFKIEPASALLLKLEEDSAQMKPEEIKEAIEIVVRDGQRLLIELDN